MAKTTGTVKHTHQYFKRRDGCWACAGRDEGCTHFMPKNMSPLPLGMVSICWQCEKEFRLTPANMDDEKPRCDNCSEQLSNIEAWLESKKDLFDKGLTNTEKALAQFKPSGVIIKKPQPKDEIEVEDAHTPECESHVGGDCTCM